ncbi:MAG TPA: hypothetical protein VFA31_06230 [Candidatus Polarisedimenticolia bacterium]|nr:hypothetical protein [Candidatus Polarisedimenticolia bacterium]
MTAIVVVSGDGRRRRDWSHELTRDGQRVIGCAARDCPLLRGERCEILGRATAAVYDEETVSPALFLALVRTPLRPTVLFARDAPSDGRHHARYTRVLSGGPDDSSTRHPH